MSLTPCPARVDFGAGCHDAQLLEKHATPVPGLLAKIQGKVDQVPIDEAAQAYIQKTSIVGLSPHEHHVQERGGREGLKSQLRSIG